MLPLSQIGPLCKQLLRTSKNLASVSATSAPVTEVSKKGDIALDRMPCIYYSIWFKKNKVQALINSGSKVNVITLVYASKLGFRVRQTDVGAQKIDSSTLETFGMVLASF